MEIPYSDHRILIEENYAIPKGISEETHCSIKLPHSNLYKRSKKRQKKIISTKLTGNLQEVCFARTKLKEKSALLLYCDIPDYDFKKISKYNDIFRSYGFDVNIWTLVIPDKVRHVYVKGFESKSKQTKAVIMNLMHLIHTGKLIGDSPCWINDVSWRRCFGTVIEIALAHIYPPSGKDVINLKSIMKKTRTTIDTYPFIDKSVCRVIIRGKLENVHKARSMIVDELPIELSFKLPTGVKAPPLDLLKAIEKHLKVRIKVRHDSEKETDHIWIKTKEKYYENLHRARRQVMFLSNFR